jgi:hypothetical protein
VLRNKIFQLAIEKGKAHLTNTALKMINESEGGEAAFANAYLADSFLNWSIVIDEDIFEPYETDGCKIRLNPSFISQITGPKDVDVDAANALKADMIILILTNIILIQIYMGEFMDGDSNVEAATLKGVAESYLDNLYCITNANDLMNIAKMFDRAKMNMVSRMRKKNE